MGGVEGTRGDSYEPQELPQIKKGEATEETAKGTTPAPADSIQEAGGSHVAARIPANANLPELHLPQGEYNPEEIAKLLEALEPLSTLPTSRSEQEEEGNTLFTRMMHMLMLMMVLRRNQERMENDLRRSAEEQEGPPIMDLIVEANGRVESISEDEFEALAEPGTIQGMIERESARIAELVEHGEEFILAALDERQTELAAVLKGLTTETASVQKMVGVLKAVRAYVTDLSGAMEVLFGAPKGSPKLSSALLRALVALSFQLEPKIAADCLAQLESKGTDYSPDPDLNV